MHPHLSATLDLARLGAALVVFLGHAAVRRHGGGVLWQLGGWGDTAVMVFFVLSGFVIAWVAATRERTAATFAAGRLSRLWSVVLPAIVLTLVVDAVRAAYAPALLATDPWYRADHPLLRPLASALFLNEAWGAGLHPGANLPFWSLGYEGFYYAAFAATTFGSGPARWWLVGALAALAGPDVCMLAPVWLAGVAIQRAQPALRRHLPPLAALAAIATGLALLAVSPALRTQFDAALPFVDARTLPRWIDGAAFALVLAGVCARPELLPFANPRLRAWLAAAASITFPLYLLHAPILHFLVMVGPADPASWTRWALLIGGTLVAVVVLTRLTDRLRAVLRPRLNALFAPAGTRAPAG